MKATKKEVTKTMLKEPIDLLGEAMICIKWAQEEGCVSSFLDDALSRMKESYGYLLDLERAEEIWENENDFRQR